MKQTQFNNMMKELINLRTECDNVVSKAGRREDFEKLTIHEANHTINIARVLESKQTIFFNAELYHIIGMGNLSAKQQSMFLKEVKKLSSSRGRLKMVAGITIPSMGEVADKSKYECKTLGIKLIQKND